MRKENKLLTLLERVGSQVSVDDYAAVLATIKRTANGILSELGIFQFNEDTAERNIEVKIVRTGRVANLYEIAIPTKTGEERGIIKTYTVYPNTKNEGETDVQASARIIEHVKNSVRDVLNKYRVNREAGNQQEANNALSELNRDYDAAMAQWQQADSSPGTRSKSGLTGEQQAAIARLQSSSAYTRASFLHARGLLTRQDVAKKLGVNSVTTLLQYVVATIQQEASDAPGWEALASAIDITAKDLDANLPKAQTNKDVLIRLMETSNIDQNSLSLDALEAITAASLAVSAGALAASGKLEAALAGA